jgi:hypothetical protein
MTDILLPACATDGLLGRGMSPPIADFMAAKPSGPGNGYLEYVARKDVQRMGAVPGRKCAVYEFPWGFITEEHGVWNFYGRSVWRAGTTNYLDLFAPAWESQAAPELSRAIQRHNGEFYVSFDDGVGIYGCISLACVLGSKGQRLAREWLAHVFLTALWPQMLARVLHKGEDAQGSQAASSALSWNNGIMPDALQSYMARSATLSRSVMASPSRG